MFVLLYVWLFVGLHRDYWVLYHALNIDILCWLCMYIILIGKCKLITVNHPIGSQYHCPLMDSRRPFWKVNNCLQDTKKQINRDYFLYSHIFVYSFDRSLQWWWRIIHYWSWNWFPYRRSSFPGFGGFRVAQSLVFSVVFDRWLYIFLSFIFWPLYYLSSFDLRLLITPLVSSTFLRRYLFT